MPQLLVPLVCPPGSFSNIVVVVVTILPNCLWCLFNTHVYTNDVIKSMMSNITCFEKYCSFDTIWWNLSNFSTSSFCVSAESSIILNKSFHVGFGTPSSCFIASPNVPILSWSTYYFIIVSILLLHMLSISISSKVCLFHCLTAIFLKQLSICW